VNVIPRRVYAGVFFCVARQVCRARFYGQGQILNVPKCARR